MSSSARQKVAEIIESSLKKSCGECDPEKIDDVMGILDLKIYRFFNQAVLEDVGKLESSKTDIKRKSLRKLLLHTEKLIKELGRVIN